MCGLVSSHAGADDLTGRISRRKSVKEKLSKVANWVQRTKPALQLLVQNSQLLSHKEGFRFRMDIRVTSNFLKIPCCFYMY